MTVMKFAQAQRKAIRPLIAIGGPSGSGKTYGALLMARGIAGPKGKLIVLDTENGRSQMYADDPTIGGFIVGDMYPPFTSASFIDAIDAAENDGADCIVIDSMTHEWSGTGGCIEQAEEMSKPGPMAWIKPKRNHARMMNRILRCQVPIIFTLRAKPELLTIKVNGKDTFAKGEMICEQESRFIYEMTLACLCDYQTNKAYYSKLKNLPKPLTGVLKDGDLINVDTGRIIKEWVSTGQAVDTALERAKALMIESAQQGLDVFAACWKNTSKEHQRQLQDEKDRLKIVAQAVDAMREDSQPEPGAFEPKDDGLGEAA